MALRRTLSKRLLGAPNPDYPSPITTLVRPPVSPPSPAVQKNEAKARRRSGFVTSPDSATSTGFFRRFLQQRAINNHSSPIIFPSFLTLPVDEKLIEKLKSIHITGHQLPRLDELSPPLSSAAPTEEGFRVDAADAKRVIGFVQIEQINERLRNSPASTITYGELVRLCGDTCGNREMGVEFDKALDESGNVIVLGGIVFLRPDQVAKSMERLISETIAMPNDPRRNELDSLEHQKDLID